MQEWPARSDKVDALRGAAVVWMTLFHLCFDLNHFGWWPQDFRGDAFWTVQRTLIVSLFLFCAGLGQALAQQTARTGGQRRFYRRWSQIAGCALLVTAGSWLIFPRSFIYFGMLHGIAVMLLLTRLLFTAKNGSGRALGRWLWLVGLLALFSSPIAHWLLNGPLSAWQDAFNSRALNWLGWVTRKPFTEDWVPLFPWLGVLCWGMACGQWLLEHRSEWLAKPLRPTARPFIALGRYSLSWYMLHQPVLLGVLWLISAVM